MIITNIQILKKPLLIIIMHIFSVIVTFGQLTKTQHVETAGTLGTLLTVEEKANVTHLTLTGKLDARDIKTTRDEMPELEFVDMAGTKILAYSGTEPGTAPDWFSNPVYPENVLPLYSYNFKLTLKSIILPDSILKIDREAFQNCTNLEIVDIGDQLVEIGTQSFIGCIKLHTINLPPQLETIKTSAFNGSTGLTELHLPVSMHTVEDAAFGGGFMAFLTVDPENMHFSTLEGVLFNKDTTTLVASPSLFSNYDLPLTVSTIGGYSFYYNSKIESITFPESLTSIMARAFDGNEKMTSVYCKAPTPPSVGWLTFRGINKTTCTLYVPIGTADIYKAANGWADFQKIVESDFSTGFETLKSDTDIRIFAAGGKLHVENVPAGTVIEVFSVSGKKLLTFNSDQSDLIGVPSGLIVVKAGNLMTKLIYN